VGGRLDSPHTLLKGCCDACVLFKRVWGKHNTPCAGPSAVLLACLQNRVVVVCVCVHPTGVCGAALQCSGACLQQQHGVRLLISTAQQLTGV
jgi:hypothetical protein